MARQAEGAGHGSVDGLPAGNQGLDQQQKPPQQPSDQLDGPDYGTYTSASAAGSVAAAFESPTFVNLASDRCVPSQPLDSVACIFLDSQGCGFFCCK